MSLHFPPGPKDGTATIERSLKAAGVGQRAGGPALQAIRPGNFDAGQPHRVYTAGLQSIAKGRLLLGAQPGPWRYLIVQNSVAVSEIQIDGETAASHGSELAGIYQSPFSEATRAALDIVSRDEQVVRDDLEVRFLTVVPLYFAALWLHGKKDLLVPLVKPPGALKANEIYSEEEILQVLKPRALNALRFDRINARRSPRSP